jgi:hypothetical protein
LIIIPVRPRSAGNKRRGPNFERGCPDKALMAESSAAVSLGIEIRGGAMCIKDVFVLSERNAGCPQEQIFYLKDGFCGLTVLTKRLPSGRWGDSRQVYLFMNSCRKMPKHLWKGVARLC